MNHISLALAISGIAYSGALPPSLVDETVQVAVTLRHDGDVPAASLAVDALCQRVPANCITAKRQFGGLLATMKLCTTAAAA